MTTQRTPDLITSLIEKLYQWAKKDPGYELPDGLPGVVLVGEVGHRGIMYLRGLWRRWRFRSVRGVLFIGRDVQIRSPRSISLGRSVTLHDHVRIDGVARNGVSLGDNVTIREYSIVECTGVLRFPGEGLVIGNDVGISQYCFIGVRGPVHIGNNVQFGPRVTVYAENHNFDDINRLIREQGVHRQGITIEDDCWLGSGCSILDGVTVGYGSVIAAGSVVTKSVPPLSVVAGVPGRIIRTRGATEGRKSS
jgi:acetyltransferase-like isoleucine patch superfamily enzyme